MLSTSTASRLALRRLRLPLTYPPRLIPARPSAPFMLSSVRPFTHRAKALVYSTHGPPPDVVRCVSLARPTSPPAPGTLSLRVLLAPVNPSDINVIEGVYPHKPAVRAHDASDNNTPLFVPGNEGLAQVVEVGEGVQGYEVGDWVIMLASQMGTWASAVDGVKPEEVLKVPRGQSSDGLPLLSEVNAATLTVNPPTAYNMLEDFVNLQEGDWVVQNGANSAVGESVIQIAAHRKLRTINFIRDRPEPAQTAHLKSHLTSLGATHVFTYTELGDKSTRAKIKALIKDSDRPWCALGLNCVGGISTSQMAGLLSVPKPSSKSSGGSGTIQPTLVSYGAMSRQPLSLPTSLLIFSDLRALGFWQTRWYETHSLSERTEVMDALVGMMRRGEVREVGAEVVELDCRADEGVEESVTLKAREALKRLAGGQVGKKVFFKFVNVDDP